jgi:hypothetical protein
MQRVAALRERRMMLAMTALVVACGAARAVQEPPRHPEKVVEKQRFEPASDDSAPVRGPPPLYGNRVVERDEDPCVKRATGTKRATDARCATDRRKLRGTNQQ